MGHSFDHYDVCRDLHITDVSRGLHQLSNVHSVHNIGQLQQSCKLRDIELGKNSMRMFLLYRIHGNHV